MKLKHIHTQEAAEYVCVSLTEKVLSRARDGILRQAVRNQELHPKLMRFLALLTSALFALAF